MLQRTEIPCMPVAPGMAMGPAYVYRDIDLAALETKRFAIENIEEEMARLEQAVLKSKEQLLDIREAQEDAEYAEAAAMFDVQLALLDDTEFLSEIRTLLDEHRLNLEHIIASKIREINVEFSKIADNIVRSRISDVHDTYHRILRNLLEIDYVRTRALQRITSPIILISERLLPSDLAHIGVQYLLGVVLDEIGDLSHVAIMLRSLGIPTVGNVPGIAAMIRQGVRVLVDAQRGAVIIGPHNQDIQRLESWREGKKKSVFKAQGRVRHETKDGVQMVLEANAGSLGEVTEAMRLGADGIGLLRSEMYYMSRAEMPTLDEESMFYRSVRSAIGDRPLIVRLLDVSMEKRVPYLAIGREENPQLGVRGVRYLLNHPELLEQQCGAIAAAAEGGETGILIPFVSLPAEMEQVIGIIENQVRRYKKKRSDISIGIMVEIPSAALDIAAYLDRLDFVSIGTNDLIQYLFAASREEGSLDRYRPALHPLLLRLIHSVVLACESAKKSVTVCGDMSSEPFSALLLAGLGVRRISLQPQAIPLVDAQLRSNSLSTLRQITQKALLFSTADEVLDLRKEIAPPDSQI